MLKFRRRIQALTIATQALASGDLTTRIPVESNDEVGILAQGQVTVNNFLDKY